MRRSLSAARIAILASALAACGSAPATPADAGADAGAEDAGDAAPPGCTTPFAGDTSKAPELVVTVIGAEPVATEVKDGDVVPLIFPPQGGRVIFAGVRARNVDPCTVTLTGALRDPATKQVRVDGRTVNLIEAADGWAESDPTDISSFSNIPVCPNQWSKTDLFGSEYDLEIVLQDRGGRQAAKTLRVKPACAEPDKLAECLCICKGGYVLGEMCAAPDAGADAGAGGSGGGGG